MLTTISAFHPLVKEDGERLAPLLTKSGYDGCEFSFTTLYMWRELYDTRIATEGDYLLISAGNGKELSFLPPIGPSFEEGLLLLRRATESLGQPLRLHGVDERTLQKLQQIAHVTATELAEDHDYLYKTSDLAELPGKPYHSKRNHIAAFSRQWDWCYEDITDDNVAAVLAMSKQWCKERGSCRDKGLQAERCGIREVLSNRRDFHVRGGLIRVQGEVVAFTFGSPINENVFDIHVEKALGAYGGAYTVINREFARRLTEFDYLNRENDMGIEGLRRAKQSYRPAALLKKYSCEVT